MTYAAVKKELSDSPRCLVCHGSAAWETLSSYGARCGQCYAAYMRNIAPAVQPPKFDGPLAWAYALQERHRTGEALSLASIDAYRTALKRGDWNESRES